MKNKLKTFLQNAAVTILILLVGVLALLLIIPVILIVWLGVFFSWLGEKFSAKPTNNLCCEPYKEFCVPATNGWQHGYKFAIQSTPATSTIPPVIVEKVPATPPITVSVITPSEPPKPLEPVAAPKEIIVEKKKPTTKKKSTPAKKKVVVRSKDGKFKKATKSKKK